MERPDAVLFDLDGTIIDSRLPFVTSMNHTLAVHGLPPREPEELWPYLGPPTHITFGELVGGDEETVNAAVATYRAHYRTRSLDTTTLYDGVEALLRELHGRVPLAVATSKPLPSARSILEHLGLAELFEVICGPSFDAVNESKAVTVGRALAGLAAAGIAVTSAVMVGDRLYDVVGAGEYGIPTVGVLWGAGSEQELTEAGARWIVSSPEEIPPLLGL